MGKEKKVKGHTPGPWQQNRNGLIEAPSAMIADVFAVDAKSYDEEKEGSEAQANAALIAAAPEYKESADLLAQFVNEIMPQLAHVACDIGLLNEGLMAHTRATKTAAVRL